MREYSRSQGTVSRYLLAQIPKHETDGEEALILERMSFYNEVMMAIEAIYQFFSEVRLSEEWSIILQRIRDWIYHEE